MAIRFGTGGRFIDHVVGTDEDDELYGYAMGESPLSDIMRDTLEGGRGDDFLFGGGGADILRGGRDDDTLEGGTGGDVLDGGEGFDTALFWHSRSAVYINLVAGEGYTGEAEGDTFISIEKVVGSEYDDVIVGDHDGNVIDGWLGDDRIWGGDGTDELYGDLGIDRLYGGGGVDFLYGGFSTDYLYGEGGADMLDGGDGDDVLRGGADSDTFIGSRGSDRNWGGDGLRDLVDYSTSSARVEVNLATGRGVGGFAQGDQYDGIEDVIGTRWDDSITGNGADNLFHGGAGADMLDGGDHLYGDTVSYESSNTGVWVDLARGAGWLGDAEGDKLGRIEHLVGSRHKDNLYGDRGGNILSGRDGGDDLHGNDGSDHLWGGAHNDRLWGDGGADYLYGGTGADRFVYTSVSDSIPSLPGAAATYDFINDFQDLELDFIDLSAIDANTTATAGGDQPFEMSYTGGFTGAGQLLIERAGALSWNVLGETTGDGVADFMIRVFCSDGSVDASDIIM